MSLLWSRYALRKGQCSPVLNLVHLSYSWNGIRRNIKSVAQNLISSADTIKSLHSCNHGCDTLPFLMTSTIWFTLTTALSILLYQELWCPFNLPKFRQSKINVAILTTCGRKLCIFTRCILYLIRCYCWQHFFLLLKEKMVKQMMTL